MTKNKPKPKPKATKVTAGQRAYRAKMAERNRNQTPEALAKLALKAKRQWEGLDSWLRTRQKEGKEATRREPPENAAQVIHIACSEYGANLSTIADLLQCHPATLREWRRRYPEIEEALTSGRKVEEDKLWSVLFRQATQEGNTTAAIVLLKMRFNQRDSGPLPNQGDDSAQTVALKIQAALKAIKEVDRC